MTPDLISELDALFARHATRIVKELTSMNKVKEHKYVCSVPEAAAIMSVSDSTIYELIKDGLIEIRMVKSKKLVVIDSIYTYLNKSK